jgi:O-antigen ligase
VWIILSIADIKALPLPSRDVLVIVSLSVYFALSVTNLPPILILCPLFASGIFLSVGTNTQNSVGHTQLDFTAKSIIALFAASYAASVALSSDIAASINATAVLFPGLLIAYILSQVSQIHLRGISWCLAILVLAPSCVTILMFFEANNVAPGMVFSQKRTPALVVPNDMLSGVIFLPVAVAIFFNEKRMFLKILVIGIVAILSAALYKVDSRICVLTTVLMVMMSFYYSRPKQFLTYCAILLLMLYLADLFLDLGLVENFLRLREENARLSIWLAGLMQWSDHPFVGFGPSNFEIAYRLGISSMELPDWILVEDRMIPWAHNIYIEALIERGVFGLTAQLMLFSLIFLGIRERSRTMARESRAFHRALLISFCGFLFAGLFEPTMQRIWVANTLFVFLGLACAPVALDKAADIVDSR